MYDIFTYIWLIYMRIGRKYTIHGSYRLYDTYAIITPGKHRKSSQPLKEYINPYEKTIVVFTEKNTFKTSSTWTPRDSVPHFFLGNCLDVSGS